MLDFEKEDVIVQLKCDPKHIFHRECLEPWIQQGHNTCPMCRKDIVNLNEITAMMEGGERESLLNNSNEEIFVDNRISY